MNVLKPHMMVLASAGSGKTYQLSNRIIGYIAMGVEPSSIVALTFTRKAAGEFTDAILSKLARVCLHNEESLALRQDFLESGETFEDRDFLRVLESLIAALPRMTLGTMDGFFTKVVKAFPLEMGISATNFQLIEGADAEVIQQNLLQSILQHELKADEAENFFQAFRRSLMGKEIIAVRSQMKDYTKKWHEHWMNGGDQIEWGPAHLADDSYIKEWMRQSLHFSQRIQDAAGQIAFTDNRQAGAWEKMAQVFANHSTGSGVMGGGNTMIERLIELIAVDAEGDQVLKHYKEFTVPAAIFELIREALCLAAKAEMASACTSTQAVAEVIEMFDRVCERRLRRKGKFSFADVKAKMSEWTLQEDKRLMREALDYRLDAKYQHWLLDEFQDTSRLDWSGLSPLIDEAMTSEGSSVFLVGDKKQAIFAWRGGDVGLFDDLRDHYGEHLGVGRMRESYRSASEVLALVNRICGNTDTINRLYGAAANRWEWEDHVAAKEDLRGHARVERIEENEDKDARLIRLAAILDEVGVGRKQLSCGVLVRTNDELKLVADYLRQQGYRVVEEGRRKPALDNPVGVTIWQWMRWLADPADSFAEEVLRLSPMWARITAEFGDFPWGKCHEAIASQGIARMVSRVIDPMRKDLSDFGNTRADDLIQALLLVDSSGGGSVKVAAQMLQELDASQSPGSAEVQVLTIHKSKGLGYDVVVLPLISSSSIPDNSKFDIARADHWICKTPPMWARKLLPPVRAVEDRWRVQQQYEGMCILYVALTRAKRGLYVLLDAKPLKDDNNSLAKWIFDSCPGESEVIFESGSLDCFADVREVVAENHMVKPTLGNAVWRFRGKTASHAAEGPSAALQYGTTMHSLMESITWLDENPFSGNGEMERNVMKLLEREDWRAMLEKRQRHVELQREIPVEGMVNGDWVRGIIDRLHLFRDDTNRIIRAEIIDYKTDRISDPDSLRARHAGQLLIYRQLIAQALDLDSGCIECILLGMHAGCIVKCD
jgi:ATP-dependent exoDNAse (exonuclease V) beta subunit